MFLEMTFNVLDGMETLQVFGNEFYAPSGSHVKPEYTNLYQNVRFMDYNKAHRDYGCTTAQHDWYIGLGFRKGTELPSRVLRQKGKKRAYLFPVECVAMRVDGISVTPSPELLLSEMDVRSAIVYTRAGKIILKGSVLTVAERENYTLRTAFYKRTLEDALNASSLIHSMPRDTWTEPERFTMPLAKLVGKTIAKVMKDTNILFSRPLTEIALKEFNDTINGNIVATSEERALVEFSSPEERLRIERMMQEIMQAEAELKGITPDELIQSLEEQVGPTT